MRSLRPEAQQTKRVLVGAREDVGGGQAAVRAAYSSRRGRTTSACPRSGRAGRSPRCRATRSSRASPRSGSCRTGRCATSTGRARSPRTPRADRGAPRGCRAHRWGSSRRRTRRSRANIFGPAAPPMSTGGPDDRLGPRPRRRELDVLAVELGGFLGPERAHREHVLAGDVASFGHGDAVVLGLVLVPPEADAEHEPSAREHVEAGDRLRGDDRLPLRDERDAGAEQDAVRDRRGHRERDERVERALVLVAELGVAGRRRGAARHRDVRVLGQVHRMQAAGLDLTRRSRPAAWSGRS